MNSADVDNCVVYSISEMVKFKSPKITSLLLVKCGSILEAEKPLLQQLGIFITHDSTPYEDLHLCASAYIAPYFKSLVKETGRAER